MRRLCLLGLLVLGLLPAPAAILAHALPMAPEVVHAQAQPPSPVRTLHYLWDGHSRGIRVVDESRAQTHYYISTINSFAGTRQLHRGEWYGPILYNMNFSYSNDYFNFQDPTSRNTAVQLKALNFDPVYSRSFSGHDGQSYVWEQSRFNTLRCIALPSRTVIAVYRKHVIPFRHAGKLQILASYVGMEPLLVATAWCMDRVLMQARIEYALSSTVQFVAHVALTLATAHLEAASNGQSIWDTTSSSSSSYGYPNGGEWREARRRVRVEELTDEENVAVFGKCNWVHGHGHNYSVEVVVKGPIHPKTGMVMNLTDLKRAITTHILDVLDHKHLDLDIPFFAERTSTAENVALFCWQALVDQLGEGVSLHEIRLHETEKSAILYRGE